MKRRLFRSDKERMIAGVCGGIAEYTGVDPVLVRLMFVLLAFASGVGIIAYIVLWIITPKGSKPAEELRGIIKEKIEEVGERAREMGEELREVLGKKSQGVEAPITSRGSFWLALVVIIIGILLLMSNLNFFWWFTWGRLWPVVLIVIGLYLMLRRR